MQQLTISDWLGQDTWSGKTSPEPSAQTEEKTFKPYSPKSFESQNQKPLMCLCLRKTSGHTPESYTMRWEDGQLPGGLTTLNTGECPNAGKESLFCLMGGGTTAAKILFEQHTGNESRPEIQPQPDSLPRDIEQSGTERKDPSATTREGANNTGEWGGTLSFQERAGKPGGGKGILIQNERTGALSTLNNQSVFGISSFESNSMKSSNPHSGIYEAETSRTLDNNGGSPACNQGGMIVLEGNGARQSHMGDGYKESEIMYTLNTVEQHAVFENHCQDSRYKALGDTCSTLATNLGTGGNNQPLVVKQPVCIGNGQADQTKESELLGALNCMHDQQAILTYGVDLYNQTQAEEIAKTLTAVKEPHSCVRRLTPLECERLQGFPDNWTDIGEWTDSKGKKHKEADAPRYKALGNSIAIPFWFWLLRRISAEYTRRATLGSLFDGIGGFPLCWEAVNGKGTARWASEIEEFPIAVTKKRFPEE